MRKGEARKGWEKEKNPTRITKTAYGAKSKRAKN
jgi:hypothetical protein